MSKFKVHEEYGHSKFWANVASENVLLANVPGLDRRTDLTPKTYLKLLYISVVFPRPIRCVMLTRMFESLRISVLF